MTTPTLPDMRRRVMRRLIEMQKCGLLPDADDRSWTDFFSFTYPAAVGAAVAAREADLPGGPYEGNPQAIAFAKRVLECVSRQFQSTGTVTPEGDQNSPYFCLTAFTWALRSLQRHVDAGWHAAMVARALQLFADAERTIWRTHDYLNPRSLEAVSALNLYHLSHEKRLLKRAGECLDQLVTRQYPCGAQPYHTSVWVWGRKPAQGYQFLTISMMLCAGGELRRKDVVAYSRRLLDFSLLATNRRGEAFVTPYEGLHKSNSRSCAGRQWVTSLAVGTPRFRGLARTTYRLWAENTLSALDRPLPRPLRGSFPLHLTALLEALVLGIREIPPAADFKPRHGIRVLPDISSVIVHEDGLDVCMNLLTGYSAFVQADCGNVCLYAVTPELTGHPTYSNAGTDALRADWQTPSEQDECRLSDGRSVLKGRVYTKWENEAGTPRSGKVLHLRRLDVTMTYEQGDLVLEFVTGQNRQAKPIPSRLLFLLIARPASALPALHIAGKPSVKIPAAGSDRRFLMKGPVGPVTFSAPDGSAVEIIPEESCARSVIAEKPPRHGAAHAKPANEGSLRLAFEGVNVLDRGRYRIRFYPCGK